MHTTPSVPISLSPLLYATAFGIAIGNTLRLFDPEMKAMAPTNVGMAFAKRRMLRAGIILYGAKVTFGKILGIGLAGLLTDLYVVSSTLLIGFGLGNLLGLSAALTTLISTGSAICGCSAVAATQPIIQAEAHEVEDHSSAYYQHLCGARATSTDHVDGPGDERQRTLHFTPYVQAREATPSGGTCRRCSTPPSGSRSTSTRGA